MPDDGPTSERLDSLRARWESDRSSGVFLQLADEYRRLGRAEDAVAVLEEGLGKNPNHPAALVALGRCRLELGRAEEATEVLERVIAGDPTQMVAYRLLVEAYVERGMPEEARQRLRVYSLLNDADPEIAELRRRIGEVERSHRGGSGVVSPEAAEEPVERTDDEPVAAIGGGEAPESVCEEAPAASSTGGAPGDRQDPFPALDDRSARDRYLAGLAGGLFDVGAAPSGAEGHGQSAAQESEIPPAPADEPTVSAAEAASGDDLFGLAGPRETPPPDLSALFGPSASREAAGAPAAPEPAPPPLQEPSPPPPARDAAGRPTVTLGRLYLRQGHRDEAAAIFREVLERDPAHAEARAELDLLEAPAEGAEGAEDGALPPLTAADLLADWHGGRDPEGMTSRKRHVLERYLERIRGRSGHDVH